MEPLFTPKEKEEPLRTQLPYRSMENTDQGVHSEQAYRQENHEAEVQSPNSTSSASPISNMSSDNDASFSGIQYLVLPPRNIGARQLPKRSTRLPDGSIILPNSRIVFMDGRIILPNGRNLLPDHRSSVENAMNTSSSDTTMNICTSTLPDERPTTSGWTTTPEKQNRNAMEGPSPTTSSTNPYKVQQEITQTENARKPETRTPLTFLKDPRKQSGSIKKSETRTPMSFLKDPRKQSGSIKKP